MTNLKRRTLPAVVAGALGMSACAAFAAEQSYSSVLSDAKTMAVAMPAMTGQGYTIGQGDMTLSIQPGIQFAYIANWGDDRKNGQGSTSDGFEVTRVRLALDGSVTKELKFFVQWDAGDISGGVGLLDAYACYQVSDQITIKAGQFKDLITHEGLVNWSDTLAADRSIVNELLGTPTGAAGRVQGVSAMWKMDQIRAEVAYHDGLGSANTNFQNAGPYFGVSGRVDVMVTGNDWAKYATLSGLGTTDTILVIGAGADYTQGEFGGGAGGYNALNFAIDGQFESNGLAVYGAFMGAWTDPRNTVADDSVFDWGAMAQVGYAFTNQMEIFARGGLVKYDAEQIADEDTFYDVTVGFNYYIIAGNPSAAKFTVQATWLPNGSPGALPYQAVLGGTDEDEIILKAQLQVKP